MSHPTAVPSKQCSAKPLGPCDLLDRLALDEVRARIGPIVSTVSIPHRWLRLSERSICNRPTFQGCKICTPIPRLKGSKLHAERRSRRHFQSIMASSITWRGASIAPTRSTCPTRSNTPISKAISIEMIRKFAFRSAGLVAGLVERDDDDGIPVVALPLPHYSSTIKSAAGDPLIGRSGSSAFDLCATAALM